MEKSFDKIKLIENDEFNFECDIRAGREPNFLRRFRDVKFHCENVHKRFWLSRPGIQQ